MPPDRIQGVTAERFAEATPATGAQASAAGDIPSAAGSSTSQSGATLTTWPRPFAVGQRVQARYGASKLGSKWDETSWYDGEIVAVHPDRSCDVLYDDGDSESRVAPRFLRVLDEAPPSPPPGLVPSAVHNEWAYGRVQGHATGEQRELMATLLSHSEWLIPLLRGTPALMVPGVNEVYFCRRAWMSRFNSDATRPTIHVIEELDGPMLALALCLEAYSDILGVLGA